MKILFFTLTDKFGGAEQLLFKLASHYKRESHEIHICILGKNSNKKWENEFSNTYYCNNSIIKFIKFLKKDNYDFIFSSHLFLNACLGYFRSLGVLKTKKLICRESTTVFGRYNGLKLLKYKAAYLIGYKKIDLLITQSESMKKTLLRNLPFLKKRTKIVTIPNLFEFPKEDITPVDINTPFIVSAGRLIPEKGFDILIESFNNIKTKFPELKLVILGEGDCKPKLQQLISAKGLSNDIILKGFVENVYPYFKGAKLCVVSSRREGFPNVLLQMMSQNNNVVSTLCAGDIDKIEGIKTCLPDDIEDLCNKIIQQLEDENTGNNRKEFDLELKKRSIDNYVKEIENSLKMKPKLFRVTTIPASLKILLKGQHRFMSERGLEVIGISSKGTALKDVEKEEGIKTIELEMTRTISPLKDLKALFSFYRLCQREKPLIVHSHTPKAGIISMLGAKLAGVPVRLHTVAGLPLMEATGVKRKILNLVEKLTYSCATMVYPNSKGLYDFILQNNFTSRKKLKVIANGSSNGINTSFFSTNQIKNEQKEELRQKLNIQSDDFVFIFVGRLVGDKGVNELVEAFIRLNNSKTKLLLVGTEEKELDPLKNQTKKYIEEHKNIIAVGFQQDVRPYFSISNALVFPSYREGFPNVVMQSGAMEVPSIVSNINGCNEIIIDKENGLIVPVKDSINLQLAMDKLVKDKELLHKLKQNSRNMIIQNYEQKLIWNDLLQEYRKHTYPYRKK